MIEVYQAGSSDAPHIVDLNRDVQLLHAEAYPWMFKHPDNGSFTEDDARTLISKANHLTFIAKVDGEAAGYVVAEERRRPATGRHHARNMMYIHEISVREKARRQGIGRALVAAVRDHGRSVGIDLLALETWSFNERAQAFFKNCGLTPYRFMMWDRPD